MLRGLTFEMGRSTMGQGPTRLYAALAVAVFAFGATWDSARAEPRYDVGATDSTIKIGNVAASSGALSLAKIGSLRGCAHVKLNLIEVCT